MIDISPKPLDAATPEMLSDFSNELIGESASISHDFSAHSVVMALTLQQHGDPAQRELGAAIVEFMNAHGRLTPEPECETEPDDELMALVVVVRQSVTKLVSQFGTGRESLLAKVLRSEIESIEERCEPECQPEPGHEIESFFSDCQRALDDSESALSRIKREIAAEPYPGTAAWCGEQLKTLCPLEYKIREQWIHVGAEIEAANYKHRSMIKIGDNPPVGLRCQAVVPILKIAIKAIARMKTWLESERTEQHDKEDRQWIKLIIKDVPGIGPIREDIDDESVRSMDYAALERETPG